MAVSGTAAQPFALLVGALNPGNRLFLGSGALDLGTHGAAFDFSDVAIAFNGFAPTAFLDLFATTGASGTQVLQFVMPNLPPGIFGAFQALVGAGPGVVRFSAAFEIEAL